MHDDVVCFTDTAHRDGSGLFAILCAGAGNEWPPAHLDGAVRLGSVLVKSVGNDTLRLVHRVPIVEASGGEPLAEPAWRKALAQVVRDAAREGVSDLAIPLPWRGATGGLMAARVLQALREASERPRRVTLYCSGRDFVEATAEVRAFAVGEESAFSPIRRVIEHLEDSKPELTALEYAEIVWLRTLWPGLGAQDSASSLERRPPRPFDEPAPSAEPSRRGREIADIGDAPETLPHGLPEGSPTSKGPPDSPSLAAVADRGSDVQQFSLQRAGPGFDARLQLDLEADSVRALDLPCSRALRGFAKTSRVPGRLEIDVPATVDRLAATRLLHPVLVQAEQRSTCAIVIVDNAAQLAPWRTQLGRLGELVQQVGCFRFHEVLAADFSDSAALHFRRRQGDAGDISTLVRPGLEHVCLILSDGVGRAFDSGALGTALAQLPAGSCVIVATPWPRHKWGRTRLGALRTVRAERLCGPASHSSRAAVALVELSPSGLREAVSFVRGTGIAVEGRSVPVRRRADARAALARPAIVDWSDKARKLAGAVEPETMRVLALAAAIPGRVDLELLDALGRIGDVDLERFHLAEAIASGFLERAETDDRSQIVRFRGEGARLSLLPFLDRSEVDCVLREVARRYSGRAARRAANALKLPLELLLRIHPREIQKEERELGPEGQDVPSYRLDPEGCAALDVILKASGLEGGVRTLLTRGSAEAQSRAGTGGEGAEPATDPGQRVPSAAAVEETAGLHTSPNAPSPPHASPYAELSQEELLDQALNYVCLSCEADVPVGDEICGRCGTAVPREVLDALMAFFADTPISGQARLIMIRGEGLDGVSYPLAAETQTVGRNGDIQLGDDPYISPTHASLFYSHNKLFVRDEGSLNGVYVRIRESVDIRPGETFLAGEQVFLLEANMVTADPPAPDGTRFFASPKPGGPFRVTQIFSGGARGIAACARSSALTIGREGFDLNFPGDVYMSVAHCVVRAEKGGRFTLTDLNSRNGTYARIEGERQLRHGDYLFIGRKLLRVELATG